LVADPYNILARWRNNDCQLLNVHGVKEFKETYMYTAEFLVLEPSAFEFEMVSEERKKTQNYQVLMKF